MVTNDNKNNAMDFDLNQEIQSMEIKLLKSALIRAKGEPAIVAKSLGIDISYVYAKAKELGLEDYIQTKD